MRTLSLTVRQHQALKEAALVQALRESKIVFTHPGQNEDSDAEPLFSEHDVLIVDQRMPKLDALVLARALGAALPQRTYSMIRSGAAEKLVRGGVIDP